MAETQDSRSSDLAGVDPGEPSGSPVGAVPDVRSRSRTTASEIVRIGILAALPILLLSPGHMLSRPYWLDESWVAITERAPLSQLLMASASTPIGWIGLMFLTPGSGEQHQRMLPLAFSIGTVIFAYLFARDLRWPTPGFGRMAGTVTAILVAIAPIALLRQDLKQYTADACVTLLIMWLVVRLADAWSTKRLWTLVGVTVAGSLVSYASMFVTVAVFAALVIDAAIHRRHRRLIDTTVASVVSAGGLLVVALVFVLPGVSDALTVYWQGWYLSPRDGVWALMGDIWRRFDALAPLLGLRWAMLTVLLGVAGIVVMARLGNRTAALVLPFLYIEMAALGMLDKYPFLDQRTSHFLLLLTVAIAAVGLSGLAIALERRWRMIGSFALAGMIAFVFYAVSPFIGTESIPIEDARSQVQHIEANYEPGDTILVSSPARWAFAHYWTADDPVFFANDRSGTGYMVDYDEDNIVVAVGRTPPEVDDGLLAALAVASLPNANLRIWLVRSHVIASEAEAWRAALDRDDLVVEIINVGPEPLVLITIR